MPWHISARVTTDSERVLLPARPTTSAPSASSSASGSHRNHAMQPQADLPRAWTLPQLRSLPRSLLRQVLQGSPGARGACDWDISTCSRPTRVTCRTDLRHALPLVTRPLQVEEYCKLGSCTVSARLRRRRLPADSARPFFVAQPITMTSPWEPSLAESKRIRAQRARPPPSSRPASCIS